VRMVVAVVLASLWAALLWGPPPTARTPVVYWEPDHPVAVAAREIMAEIPGDASVSAHYALCPHLSPPGGGLHVPHPLQALLYGPGTTLEGQRLPRPTRWSTSCCRCTGAERREEWLTVAADFVLVDSNDWWELYRRKDAE